MVLLFLSYGKCLSEAIILILINISTPTKAFDIKEFLCWYTSETLLYVFASSAGPAPDGAPPLPAHPGQGDAERECHHPEGLVGWSPAVLQSRQWYEKNQSRLEMYWPIYRLHQSTATYEKVDFSKLASSVSLKWSTVWKTSTVSLNCTDTFQRSH